ncbi:MAG: Holliday junction branch migration protein RuvA [Candidatus Marinimicrobia bacterium]|nr:Holliday junction branch migration protein RuvA [Candidatus Neomarinimicrobiota bacterium]|tara:strand:+ start:84 stop:674 length:591 start_codon:yes stop_codon:yes gene_type:complete
MIDYIRGKLDKKDLSSAVISVNGIGYKVVMSINSLEKLPDVKDDVQLLTYLHVREDAMDLFGFMSENEREIFHLLLNINGIGPKLAITILSGIKPNQLQLCILESDIAQLTKIPGIGSKTAKRMILELKDKFDPKDKGDLEFISSEVSSQLFNDAVNSLVTLGYKSEDAKKICKKLDQKGELVGNLEMIIKKALRH